MSNVPKITPALKAEAKSNPGGWVYHVDWNYKSDEYTPPEAIVGAWEVDESGDIIGEFRRNENYSPVIFAKRKPRQYMERGLSKTDFDEWVIEMDPDFDDSFPDVPPEGITGYWYIGKDGKFTGQFRPNPKYKGDLGT